MTVKKKIPKYKSECRKHAIAARKILKNKVKDILYSKHKGGKFILRWSGDKISLFLEVAFYKDMTPVKRKISYKYKKF